VLRRDEIAECSERAYASLAVADARKLMLFSSDQEALAYAQEVTPYFSLS
jgi:26S proteasome regulatory subunit N12